MTTQIQQLRIQHRKRGGSVRGGNCLAIATRRFLPGFSIANSIITSSTLASMSAIRLTQGLLYADLVVDRRSPQPVWMYVVQRKGSPEVLALGSCLSEQEARDTAKRFMKEYRVKAVSA